MGEMDFIPMTQVVERSQILLISLFCKMGTDADDRGLKGKVIVITGGCGDIGSAMVRRLARCGGRVVVWDILEDELGKSHVTGLGGIEYRRIDQGNAAEIHAGIDDTTKPGELPSILRSGGKIAAG
jgi:NAD(P)-dependent dehydrogenase (short-subunit alcohol dehydrogenase family)